MRAMISPGCPSGLLTADRVAGRVLSCAVVCCAVWRLRCVGGGVSPPWTAWPAVAPSAQTPPANHRAALHGYLAAGGSAAGTVPTTKSLPHTRPGTAAVSSSPTPRYLPTRTHSRICHACGQDPSHVLTLSLPHFAQHVAISVDCPQHCPQGACRGLHRSAASWRTTRAWRTLPVLRGLSTAPRPATAVSTLDARLHADVQSRIRLLIAASSPRQRPVHEPSSSGMLEASPDRLLAALAE
ncbi:hypothetical protein MRB53_041020 [Persea americana]|nr:hypothetical protein MRB53_041020 [Persea americana]